MVILQQNSEPIPGYFLAEKIGEGSFGVVWSADGPGQTRVALKFLDLNQAGGVKEFEAISAIKNIRHPNLLPILGYWLLNDRGHVVGEGGASLFRSLASQPRTLVIAMVAGEKSLADVLDHYRSTGHVGIPIEQLLQYIEDTARGLDFLNTPRHDLGDGRLSSIQHRDIKPDNILIVGDAAVLCDFGVARASHADSIRTTGMIGSPAFISPESISGSGSSRASDQYSLALTYYYLRTGTHAVVATSQATAIHCHVTGELDFSKVGQAEREALLRATHLDVLQRFESCRDMVRAIARSTVGAEAVHCHDQGSGLRASDVASTHVDHRFQSTTAADGAEQCLAYPMPVSTSRGSVPSGHPCDKKIGTKTASWRRGRRSNHSLPRSAASSTAMVALAMVALSMVSGGPKVAAHPKPLQRPEIDVEPYVAVESSQGTTADGVLETEVTIANQSVLESVSPEFLQPELQEPELTASDPTPMMVPSSNESTDVVELDFELPVEAEVVSAEESALGVYRSLGARIDIDTGVLDLSGTKITDEQLSSLADLPKLSSLSLENTAVGDLGLLEITRHQPNLQSLYLSKTKVSDAGLVCLGDLNKLSRLDLSSCDVHDEGIKHLHVLEGLTAIGLESTKVSDQGVMRLSEALRHGAVIQGPQFNLLGGERF